MEFAKMSQIQNIKCCHLVVLKVINTSRDGWYLI